MPTQPHHRPQQQFQLRDTWVVFFILGITLMNFPFLGIFNKALVILGFPLLFIYLFVGWVFSIAVIFLFSLSAGSSDPKHTEKRQP